MSVDLHIILYQRVIKVTKIKGNDYIEKIDTRNKEYEITKITRTETKVKEQP